MSFCDVQALVEGLMIFFMFVNAIGPSVYGHGRENSWYIYSQLCLDVMWSDKPLDQKPSLTDQLLEFIAMQSFKVKSTSSLHSKLCATFNLL